MSLQWRLPELAWVDQRIQPRLAVGVEAGRITAVVPADTLPQDAPRVEMPRKLLLPGFVNAHSHAFQRVFRGQTEFLRAGHESEDFWSWRQQMYDAAGRLDPEGVYNIARRLYREMRAAGFTSVGEFHYLHHQPDGSPYAEATRLTDAVAQAAVDAGLRISVLMVLYHTGGIGEPAAPRQRRFISPSLEDYLSLVEAALAKWDSHPGVTIGLAPHSIRAVPVGWLERLAEWNRGHGLPVHMHLCEQTAEIEASRRLLGAAPIEIVARTGLLEGLTAVHATHLEPGDPSLLAKAGARVCACPTTEANLGDGFLPGFELLEAGVGLCIGSDSHIVVNPFEELRLIENNERLRRRRRNVLAPLFEPDADNPERRRIAPGLLDIGTRRGAEALGLPTGAIAPGLWADLIAVDLDDPALEGVPPRFLPEALVFSADTRCVRDARLQRHPAMNDRVAAGRV